MKVEVPEEFRKIADPKEGEKLIGITAKGDDIYNPVWLRMSIHEAETGVLPEDMVIAYMTVFQILRTGWIEEPAPNMSNLLGTRPLGKLWVVYKDLPTTKGNVLNCHSRQFEEEKHKTKTCLTGVMQYLEHDTSSTRLQLAQILRQRAELIESEVRVDYVSGRTSHAL